MFGRKKIISESSPRQKYQRLRSEFLRQCLVVAVLGLAIGAGGYWLAKGESNFSFQGLVDKIPDTLDFSKKSAVEAVTFKPGEGETTDYCPICGIKLAQALNTRPLAVVIDNSAKGRPQSGLLEADVIYEVPVEGGLTRFLAIYTHGAAGKIGPIRSTRPYFLTIGQEYDSVQVHSGGSSEALQMISQQKLASTNEISKSAATAFWRSQQRVKPYNLYSSNERIRIAVEKGKYEKEVSLSGPRFYSLGNGPVGWTPAASVIIEFSNSSKVKFSYEANKLVYLRQMGDKPHQDGDSGQQLAASNVIVQWVSQKTLDKQGRLDLGIIGSGPAKVYTQGQFVEAVWSRAVGENKTYYRDNNGVEIPLSPGQTWIEIVSQGTKVE